MVKMTKEQLLEEIYSKINHDKLDQSQNRDTRDLCIKKETRHNKNFVSEIISQYNEFSKKYGKISFKIDTMYNSHLGKEEASMAYEPPNLDPYFIVKWKLRF